MDALNTFEYPRLCKLRKVPSRFWYNFSLPLSEQRILLLVGDVSALILSAAFTFRVVGSEYHAVHQVVWVLLLIAAWVTIGFVNECYEMQQNTQRQILKHISLTALETMLLYAAVLLTLNQFNPFKEISFTLDSIDLVNLRILPSFLPVIFLSTSFVAVLAWRVSYSKFFTTSLMQRRVVIVGAGHAGRIAVQVMRMTHRSYEIIGFIDDDNAKQGKIIEGIPVIGTHRDLLPWVVQQGVREIILAITHEIRTELLQQLMLCYEQGIPIKPMQLLYEETLERIPVEHLSNKWLPLPFWNNSKTPTFYRIIKRAMDILLGLVGLIILVIVFPFIFVAIKLDSRGPVFYSQERVGQGGKLFKIMKFRSMVDNAEKNGEAVWATRCDPRITRVGRFLRRTRLDELPQVFSVLKGDMSIIGPRPERQQFVDQLQEKIPFYRARLSVKPGLTGWAQVKYRYGNSVEDALIKLQYDLYYIKHQSIMLDLLIILRTIKVVLAFKGT